MSIKKANTLSHKTKPKKNTQVPMRKSEDLSTLEAGRIAYMQGKFDESMRIWTPLAENGDPEAQVWVGSLFANGDGVDVSAEIAFSWYLRSAEGGNAQAQANIGAMYAMGKGIDQDMEKAVRWMRRAARNGDANAQFNMAVLYTKGDGVRESLEKAAEWYRRGAENGHYPSQGRLGHMYYTGEGVKKDRIEAFLWLSLAGQHGIGSALTELEKVVGEMSADEKAAGMSLVDAWKAHRQEADQPTVFSPQPN